MKKICGVFAVAAIGMWTVWAVPAGAQTAAVKEKPPMFTYVANWQIPRAQWGEMDKARSADEPILKKALADGTLVGYGSDVTLVHTPKGETHDDWWSSMSMAGLLNVLNQFYTSGNDVTPVLNSATRHWDGIYVSRYYNWHSGSYTGAYTYVAEYKLKADAPDDALDVLSKNLIAPMLEKLVADGTLHEYEIDTQALHTEDPSLFSIVYVAAHANGIDKVRAAIEESGKANPFIDPAFGAMVDYSAHRDELLQSDGTYK